MRFTVTKSIIAGLTLILLAGSGLGLVLYADLNQIIATLERVLQIEEPASAAAYEMEINALGSTLAVLKYRDHQKPEFRQRLTKDAGDFERFYAGYEKLVADPKGRHLGKQAHALFQEIKTLGLTMMDGSDAAKTLSNEFAQRAKKTESLIEDKLLPSIGDQTPQALQKSLALQTLDSNLAEIGDALGDFLHTYDPAYRQRMAVDAADFRAALSAFRRLGLEPAQQQTALAIEREFDLAMRVAEKNIQAGIVLRDQEIRLIALRQQIDDVLDEGIQTLSAARLGKAKAEADQSAREAQGVMLLLMPLLVGVSLGAGVLMVNLIRRPIRELIAGTKALGGGDLGHRIPLHGDDEFTELAAQFNRMAEHLQQTTVSKENLKTSEKKLQHANASLLEEIEQHHKSQEIIRQMAYYDPLTDLPNRRLFHDRLQQAILGAHREKREVAVLLMDLDRFKEVNDTLGHHYGDELLKQVSARLHGLLREFDTVARLGGDEFAVLMMPSTDEAGATLTAEKILHAVRQPYTLGEVRFEIGASVGIALFPEHGEDSSTLLRCADVAMYAAKGHGGGYAVYGPEHDHHSTERLTLMGDLNHAIEHGELVLHYQPLISAATRKLSSAEALVRWNHPTRGFLMPDDFIPLAEKTGAITPMTLWVLEEAIRQGSLWRAAGMDLPVAVNVSATSLHYQPLAEKIGELLQRYDLPSNRLKLEITESAIMSDPGYAMKVLSRLSEMGLSLAIDDFGTGYSSLAYLSRLPVKCIKIDKSFVIGMSRNMDDEIIVRSTIDLSHNLRLKVTAEGVEEIESWDKLAGFGCDTAQGYYISHPLAAAEFAAWASTSKWA